MRRLLILCCALAAGCGGGGGPGTPGPPLPSYAVTTSTGLAVGTSFAGAAALTPAEIVAGVSEAEMGADLNGDGDQLDRVAHVVNTVTGFSTNLRVAIVGPILVSDRHFAFTVDEAAQNSTDINLDGDSNDGVWFVYNPALPVATSVNPSNTGLATPPIGLPGVGVAGGFVLLQSEANSNQDVNSDGDMFDIIPIAFDGATFTVSGAAVPAHAGGTRLVARNGRVLLAHSEASATMDLNGDTDFQDTVLGYVDFSLGLPIYFLVGGNFGRSVGNLPYDLTDGAAVYFIDEATNGTGDLNNDGDTLDAIIALFDIATGGGETLPQNPLIPAFALAGAPAIGIGAGPDRVIVAVDEFSQGLRDINLDFDANDAILGWINTAAPTTIHLLPAVSLGPIPPRIDSLRGLIAVSEAGSAFMGTDLNGDTDINDNVVHLLDTSFAPGTVTNLGYAVASFSVQGDDALLGVDEAADAGIDRNGDSMADDVVPHYCDLAAQPATPRSLAIVASGLTFFRLSPTELRIAARLPEGQSPNFNDLNRDGDIDDFGVELIAIDPSGAPPAIVLPTPFFAGTESLGIAPPLRLGDATFAFATAEAMDGRDLNGDGDLLDTVLRYTTIRP